MSSSHISKVAARAGWALVLRYGAAIVLVAAALGTALILRYANLPHPFTSFSFAAIAVAFWYGGTGPGLLALLLSCLGISDFFMPIRITDLSSESYIAIYGIFGLLVSRFSTSRHRAERLLTESRDSLEIRVVERTIELTEANEQLQSTQAELRGEKDRLKLLLDLNNTMVSKLELRDLLRVISASVRQMMQCDCVSVNLPDPETGELRLYALDFPDAKGFLQEGMLHAPGSLAARVFSTGQPSTFRLGSGSSPDPEAVSKLYRDEGVQSFCWLPLISHGRGLGVLGLSRFAATSFSQDDVYFLMQVASQVAIAVENALAYGQISELTGKLAQEKLYLEDEIRTEANFKEIVGKSQALQRVLKLVETVAPTGSTVLIYGETGTGKELIARAIHDLSPRNSRTFVKLNCAALPAGLLESELFGHEKGAFTGAVAQRIGRLELANHGTLFLDEVGEIPLELQPKLLRILQEREFERLGSTRSIQTDVRLIAATNRNLGHMVEEQKFRSDLFFRLNVFPIEVPPLRERPEDIPLLVRHFVEEFSRRMNRRIETVSSETMNVLCQYAWPGNIRELQNVIERAVILSSGSSLKVPVAELHAGPMPVSEEAAPTAPRRRPVRSILAEVDRNQIVQALKEASGRVGGRDGAAARLGLKRTTFITRMKKLGIDADRVSEPKVDSADTSDTSVASIVQDSPSDVSSSR
jgi:formate hydrogenlyase transcriptional activator